MTCVTFYVTFHAYIHRETVIANFWAHQEEDRPVVEAELMKKVNDNGVPVKLEWKYVHSRIYDIMEICVYVSRTWNLLQLLYVCI